MQASTVHIVYHLCVLVEDSFHFNEVAALIAQSLH